MIYVTHDQIEAMTLADRIVLMRDGRIEQQGAPLELFERPATRFVAGFLGSPQMNFLAGTLLCTGPSQAIRLDGDGTRLALPQARALNGAADGKPVLLGLRPEHMARAFGATPPDSSSRTRRGYRAPPADRLPHLCDLPVRRRAGRCRVAGA